VAPEEAGVIIRTAAEGASEEEFARDLSRLRAQWEDIQKKAKTASPPALIYSEPDLVVRVVRDVFNEDFTHLYVQGDSEWDTVEAYLGHVAPDLAARATRWDDGEDLFARYRVDEQLAKALDRKVWLPSGGSLVIDRTEAMTVVDVNTGKFTGAGSNLEETVTRNNLEAAEEIVRQLRLRDIGGIVVIDFIDMVLESNRELVLRRMIECLGRDRTRHQVGEFTSLGLVQLTRKRVGQALLEAFSEPCPECGGRGVKITLDPFQRPDGERRSRRRGGRKAAAKAEPAVEEPAPGDADELAAAAAGVNEDAAAPELGPAVVADEPIETTPARRRGRRTRRAAEVEAAAVATAE
jgi:ribonuclease E